MSLAMLQIVRVSEAAVTVNGEPVSVKSTLHPVHMGVQDHQMEARSSFSPTTTNNASPVNLGGGGGNGGINIVNPVGAISRSGQVIYAQNRDSYAQAAQSAGYNNGGSSSGGTSAGSYAAPSQPGAAYGTPTQNPQRSMTYYYYHYPSAAQPYSGDSTGYSDDDGFGLDGAGLGGLAGLFGLKGLKGLGGLGLLALLKLLKPLI